MTNKYRSQHLLGVSRPIKHKLALSSPEEYEQHEHVTREAPQQNFKVKFRRAEGGKGLTRAVDTCRNHSQPINNERGCGQIN